MSGFFPMSLVTPIMESFERLLPEHQVVARSLGLSEGTDTIGVFPSAWRPIENSTLMGMTLGNMASTEPSLGSYAIRIQNLRIDADEIIGREAFNNTCKKIKAILYRDPVLQLALRSLTEELLGTVERMKKFDIVKQDYLSSMTNMGMFYLGTTEVIFQTESTPTS